MWDMNAEKCVNVYNQEITAYKKNRDFWIENHFSKNYDE